jgi:choline dehydrogenase-like flavoprotein
MQPAYPSDPGPAADANGAVCGVEGLHVIGGPIMPDIVSAPANVTTAMIAGVMGRKLSGRRSEQPLAFLQTLRTQRR